MSPDEFLSDLAEILEIDRSEIALETRLEDLAIWDSINVLSYMALVDEKFGKEVDPERIAQAETVGDLCRMAVG
jgi:acyl carrier protein